MNLAAAGPVIPEYGKHSSSCLVHNHLFCWQWVTDNWGSVLWPALRQHVYLAAIAVSIGLVIAMALALVAHRYRWLEQPTVLVTTFLYTIPSLALFELLVAPVGANLYAAEIALVSYTLLILFRNILTGLRGVPEEVLDAAEGMGMTRTQQLLRALQDRADRRGGAHDRLRDPFRRTARAAPARLDSVGANPREGRVGRRA